jgi:site-specific recombinase XerD
MEILEEIKIEGQLRKLSIRTIKTYCFYAEKFIRFTGKEPWRITKYDVRDYLCAFAEHHSANTVNIAHNAIAFMVREVMHRNWHMRIRFAKVPQTLPTVLTKEEVLILLSAIENPKHKLMISLMYSAGLRLSELIKLKAVDIELGSNIGWVRQGKGNKDRHFMIAECIKDDLNELMKTHESYLFTGNKDYHISKETIYRIVKNAAKKAGIKKNVHPHTLRHSFATHLILNGYDVKDAQIVLGHKSEKTTMRYVHIANQRMIHIKSPFDSL